MSESKSRLDPNTVLQQTAALAKHLQDSGVGWISQPNAEKVEELSKAFDFGSSPADREDKQPDRHSPRSVATTPTQSIEQQSAPRQSPSPAISSSGSNPYPGENLSHDDRVAQLTQLSNEVSSCTRCELLAKCRTNTVFGEGNASPRFVFFGEGPGRDEDLQGRPFVGRAGQLLTKMIEACKLSRDEIYILNTVKCRPPNNRNPEPNEIENCRRFFEEQLQILRPEYIVCLGAVSMQTLLRTKSSVGRLRGKLHPYFASKVLVTYHPAYLLRAPAAKKAAWDDLQLMLRDAGMM